MDALTPLSKQTGITIGLGMLILGTAVSAAWWFGKWTGADSAWKQETNKRLLAIEVSVDKAVINGAQNRWTATDMLRWTRRLAEANPSLKVPEPYIDR